jgi:hypothetical protein
MPTRENNVSQGKKNILDAIANSQFVTTRRPDRHTPKKALSSFDCFGACQTSVNDLGSREGEPIWN